MSDFEDKNHEEIEHGWKFDGTSFHPNFGGRE